MTGDIREHLERQPFVPFTIHMADGQKIPVATREHVAVSRTHVIATHDNDSYDVLSSLLMSGLIVDEPAPQSEQR